MLHLEDLFGVIAIGLALFWSEVFFVFYINNCIFLNLVGKFLWQ